MQDWAVRNLASFSFLVDLIWVMGEGWIQGLGDLQG